MKYEISKNATNGSELNITFELLIFNHVCKAKYMKDAKRPDNPDPELQADVQFYSNKLEYETNTVWPNVIYIDTKPTPNNAINVLSFATATKIKPIIANAATMTTTSEIRTKC